MSNYYVEYSDKLTIGVDKEKQTFSFYGEKHPREDGDDSVTLPWSEIDNAFEALTYIKVIIKQDAGK